LTDYSPKCGESPANQNWPKSILFTNLRSVNFTVLRSEDGSGRSLRSRRGGTVSQAADIYLK
jgi:hypothetical protein